MVIGAFSAANNKENGRFSTVPVKGNISILEYYEPASVQGLGTLHISRVIHGYKSGGYGESGTCNKNVNCPEGASWGNQKRAVVMILLSSGTRWYSGAMINNVEQDLTSYLLTAFHCIDSNKNGTLSSSEIQDAEDWIIMFNYESPDCSNIDGPTNQTVSGSTFKAGNQASDFALLSLYAQPPRSYDVYYSGWSRSTSAPNTTVCIHHPSGDIKKISFDTDYPTHLGNFWKVNDWDIGTTESGSSGSPLFDTNHRIMGQLLGGKASCNNSLWDKFGKFSVSWSGGDTSSTRLKEWLDPNNTGVTTLNGMNDPRPYPPTNLNISGCTGCMPTISWTSSPSSVSYYKLYRRSSNTAFILIATTTGTSWIDSQITIENPGTDLYTYKVKAMGTNGWWSEYSNLAYTGGSPFSPWKVLASNTIPDVYALRENYPNPFNPITTIRYELPEDSFTELRIYDIMGREIRTLVNGNEAAGYKNMLWDGKDSFGNPVSSGMYIYHISATSKESNLQFSQTRKMILMK